MQRYAAPSDICRDSNFQPLLKTDPAYQHCTGNIEKSLQQINKVRTMWGSIKLARQQVLQRLSDHQHSQRQEVGEWDGGSMEHCGWDVRPYRRDLALSMFVPMLTKYTEYTLPGALNTPAGSLQEQAIQVCLGISRWTLRLRIMAPLMVRAGLRKERSQCKFLRNPLMVSFRDQFTILTEVGPCSLNNACQFCSCCVDDCITICKVVQGK